MLVNARLEGVPANNLIINNYSCRHELFSPDFRLSLGMCGGKHVT